MDAKRATTWVLAGLILAIAYGGWATSSAEQKGAAWLAGQVTEAGGVVDESASVGTSVQIRSEIVHTYHVLSIPAPAGLLDAVGAELDGNSEYLARQLQTYVLAGRDGSAFATALLSHQNADGGFGSLPGYRSNPLETAFALIALKAGNSSDTTVLSSALSYLAASANADGGYGLPDSSSNSQIYTTTYALQALQSYSQVYSLTTPIAAAKRWLVEQQVNGSYGDTMLNALAVTALMASSTNTADFSGPLNAVTNQQAADGSWDADPYVTAIALRALAVFEKQSQGTTPAPLPTTGTIVGTVVEQGSLAPLADAQLRLLEQSTAQLRSNGDGGFTFTDVAAGSYTLEVAKDGYATVTLAGVDVVAGSVANVGNINLPLSSAAATLRGKVSDGAGGAPLAGVSISLSGAVTTSTATDANGNYEFIGLPAGTVAIEMSKSGYVSISVSATLALNYVTVFSPSLYLADTGGGSGAGTVPTTATLQGQIADFSGGQPIAGAVVAVDATTVMTDAAGAFSMTGLAAGSFSATVSADGYQGSTLTGSLANGVNDLGTIRLAKLSANATTVSGTVRDVTSGQALAGATVTLDDTGEALTTAADGQYRFTGITAKSFAVTAGAPGYQSLDANITANVGDAVVMDFSLAKNPPVGGIQIDSVTTSQTAYDPYGEVEIVTEAANSSSEPADLIFSATLQDANGNIVAEAPAVPLLLGENPADAALRLDAGSRLSVTIDWQNTNTPAGQYSVVVRATDLGGALVAEGGTSFAINQVQRLGGGITLSPPITQADANQPIAIASNIANSGNAEIPPGQVELTVTLAHPDNILPSSPNVDVKTVAGGEPLATPQGGVFDDAGNFYTVNGKDRRVVKIDTAGQASVYATLPSTFGGTSVSPKDIARDRSGNLWILNASYFVLKLAPDGALSNLSTGLIAQRGLDLDASGNLFITGTASGGDQVLLKLDAAGQATTLARNGLSKPVGIVALGNGQWLVSNSNDGTIARIDAAGTVGTYAKGLNSPQGMTLDSRGNLFIANSGADNVVKIATDGSQSVYASGLNNPADLRFDSNGNLFVSNPGDNTIAKVRPDGSVETFARGIAVNPQGAKYDAAGNLYLANGNGTVTRLGADGAYSVIATSLSTPKDLEIAANGDVYVANNGNGRISKISGGVASAFATGLKSPYGLAFDGNGVLHVAEGGANRISALDANGQATTVLESLLNSPRDALVAANGDIYILNGQYISRIGADGQGAVVARDLSSASGFTQGSDGGFYVVDGDATLKKVTPAGAVSTLATGLSKNSGGAIATDAAGNIYWGDYSGRRLLSIDAAGSISTFASLSFSPNRLVADGSGGFYALSSTGDVYAISAAGAASFITGVYSGRTLARTADGGLLVATSSSVTAISPLGVKTTLQSGLSDVSAAVPALNGGLVVCERSSAQLTIYDAAGIALEHVAGFSVPRDILWTGGGFVFADNSSNILSWQAGKLPRRIGSGHLAAYLAERNGVLYVSHSAGVGALASDGSWSDYFKRDGLSDVTGLAFRPDGALTLANSADSGVLTLDASKRVVAAYAGFSSPGALAIDSAGNVYVGMGDLVKIDASGKFSDVFSPNVYVGGLAFDRNGVLHGSTGSAIYRFDDAGGHTSVATVSNPGGSSNRIAFDGETLLATATNGGLVYRVENGGVIPFAAGIADTYGVRVADGVVYMAGMGNGTITKYDGAGLSVHAGGLTSPSRLLFGQSGKLYVAGGSGSLLAIDGDGGITDLKLQETLGTYVFHGMAISGQGLIMLTRPDRHDVYSFQEPSTPALPQAGTVVHSAVADLPALPVGGDRAALAWGDWTPPYSGDYEVRLRSLQADVSGQLVNYLHVGPHASGRMGVDRTTLAPTSDRVKVAIDVVGADSTGLSRIDAGNLVRVATSVTAPRAMGADAAGNLYVGNGSAIQKIDSAGAATTFYNKASYIRGQLPVDTAGNLYVGGSGTNSNQVLRIAPDGSASVLATLSGFIFSLAIDQQDQLYAALSNQIVKIRQDGSQSVLTSIGVNSPWAMAIDGKGNLYLQSGDSINRIGPDGSASTLLTDVRFELEGISIAGDCSDNVFATAMEWPAVGQETGYEEHVVGQIVGRSGQALSVFDGRSASEQIQDIDFLAFDRFSNSLLVYNDYGGRIYRLPVTCGAIGTELHVVLPQGQTAEGLNPAPGAVLAKTDGSTEYVWNLKDVTAQGQSLRFETVLDGLVLGEERPVAQDAFLSFQNSFAAEDIQTPIAIPMIKVDNLVQLAVTPDQPSYPADSAAVVAVDLANSNAAAVNGQVTLAVYDAQGVLVASLLAEQAEIGAYGDLHWAQAWNTGAIQAGDYTAKAALLDAAGATLAQASAGFQILAGDGSGATLSAAVSTDKTAYQAYDVATIDGRVRNLTNNLFFDNLSVGETVTDPAGQPIYTASQTLPQLLGGQIKDLTFDLHLNSAAPGVYTVEQRVAAADGRLLDQRTATFRVLSTAETGSGLKGALSVSPKEITGGGAVYLSASVQNLGNVDLTQLPLKLSVLDPAAGQVLAEWSEPADLARQQTYYLSRTWQAPAGAAAYAVVLSADINGTAMALASDTFKVLAPPIALTPTAGRRDETRLLVLVSCEPGADGDGHDESTNADEQGHEAGDDDSACATQRAQWLDGRLAAAGTTHLATTRQKVFRHALRSGRYNVYWISGGGEKLEDTLAQELREAVRRGDGLLLDGLHDERNRLAEAMAGVVYRGKLPQQDYTVQLDSGLFSGTALPSAGSAGKYLLDGAAARGVFPQAAARLAVADRDWDQGGVLLFAFDLPASLMHDDAWQAELDTALKHVRPPMPASYTGGGFAPLAFTVANNGDAASVAAAAQLPADILLEGLPDGAVLDAQGWPTWQFDLAADSSRTQALDVRAPFATGSYSVPFAFTATANGASQTYNQTSASFEVRSADQIEPSLAAALDTLAPTSSDERKSRDKALAALQQAQALLQNNQPDDAIAQYLYAAGELAKIQSVAVDSLQLDLSKLLAEAEYRAYAALPEDDKKQCR